MADDKAVVDIVAFAQDVRHAQPVRGADIGAVQVIKLEAVYPAELPDVRDEFQQLLRVQLRGQALGGHLRGDGASGADHENLLHTHLL